MHAPQSHEYIANRHAPLSQRAILDLKTQRDKLHQYQRRITVLTDRETEIAKQMLAKGDKKRALLALRRKKYQESLLAQTDGQLEQLEKLTANVEFAQIQKDVVFGLQQGTKVLKEIHAEMGGIEHVEKLMGETADAIAYQNVSVPAEVSEGLPPVPLPIYSPPGPLAPARRDQVQALMSGCNTVGGQRDAWGQDIESGRGRGGGRARGHGSRAGRTGAAAQRPRYRTPSPRDCTRPTDCKGATETTGTAGHACIMISRDARYQALLYLSEVRLRGYHCGPCVQQYAAQSRHH